MQLCFTAAAVCWDVHNSKHIDLTAEVTLLFWMTKGRTPASGVVLLACS
jgi:hypothetical protein